MKKEKKMKAKHQKKPKYSTFKIERLAHSHRTIFVTNSGKRSADISAHSLFAFNYEISY